MRRFYNSLYRFFDGFDRVFWTRQDILAQCSQTQGFSPNQLTCLKVSSNPEDLGLAGSGV